MMAQQMSPLDGQHSDSPNGTSNGRVKASPDNDDDIANGATLSLNSHKNELPSAFGVINTNEVLNHFFSYECYALRFGSHDFLCIAPSKNTKT